jgi:hypothetical protein
MTRSGHFVCYVGEPKLVLGFLALLTSSGTRVIDIVQPVKSKNTDQNLLGSFPVFIIALPNSSVNPNPPIVATMPKIVRLTLFKIPDEGTVKEAVQKYATLVQDAKKVRT